MHLRCPPSSFSIAHAALLLALGSALGLSLSPNLVLAEPAKLAAAAPAAAPAAPATTAAPAAAAPAPAAEPAVAAAPPPAPAPQAAPPPPPGDNPPPPPYPMLGGQPEPAIERGEWNPWDHPEPGRYSHEGFFMRLNLGFGGGSVSGHTYSFSGPGFGMGVAVGGSIVDNLALHVGLQRTMLLGPTQKPSYAPQYVDAISLTSLDIGLTYYFMPVNIYISGSGGVGPTTFENSQGQQYGDTYYGFVGNLMAGKEWWVGYDWGVGVAAQLLLSTLRNDVDGRVVSAALNIMFSATYN
ncbi:MAG TPA: hypothetical protein VF331_03320 [Polyangiales bacterium]